MNGVKFYLIGNKMDLVGEDSSLELQARDLAAKYSMNFNLISACTGENVSKVFLHAVSKL